MARTNSSAVVASPGGAVTKDVTTFLSGIMTLPLCPDGGDKLANFLLVEVIDNTLMPGYEVVASQIIDGVMLKKWTTNGRFEGIFKLNKGENLRPSDLNSGGVLTLAVKLVFKSFIKTWTGQSLPDNIDNVEVKIIIFPIPF